MSPASKRPWEARPIPNKGIGVVATEPILMGTRLLCEAPLYTREMTSDAIEEQDAAIEDELLALPQTAQNAFFQLANSFEALYPDDRYYAVATTNEVTLSGHHSGLSGLFLEWSRFNHSCVPNAYWTWRDDDPEGSEDNGRLTVHARRDIDEGEEICISYFQNRVMPHDEREKYLAEVYCFECTCPLCSLPPGEERAEMDEKLSRLAAFWRKYHAGLDESELEARRIGLAGGGGGGGDEGDGEARPKKGAADGGGEEEEDDEDDQEEEEEDQEAPGPVDVREMNKRRFLQDPETCYAECREAAGIIGRDEDVQGCMSITFAYEIALAVAMARGDAARAGVFALRNYVAYRTVVGEDNASTRLARVCAGNPRGDRLFGLAGRLVKSAPPRRATRRDFDDWLWSTKDWGLHRPRDDDDDDGGGGGDGHGSS